MKSCFEPKESHSNAEFRQVFFSQKNSGEFSISDKLDSRTETCGGLWSGLWTQSDSLTIRAALLTVTNGSEARRGTAGLRGRTRHKNMDVHEHALPDTVNPNNFPAKLWRLVNNPAYTAICWDNHGEGILIEKPLFEEQILSPGNFLLGNFLPDNADTFKTTNFSSFVRQLNLYGFRKTETPKEDDQRPRRTSGDIHNFYNPIFKRNHPELVAGLRRLTADYKAKIEAGQDIGCQPPSKYMRYSGVVDAGGRNVNREIFQLLSPTNQESTHPYFPKKGQPGTVHNGTPVPPRYLMRGHGAALSPTVFTSDKGIQVSYNHQYAGVASSSNAVPVLSGSPAHVNHGNVQYQPGYFSPVCQCYQMNQASQLTRSRLPTGSFSPYSFYQASHTVNVSSAGDHSQDPQNMKNQEIKKGGISLDTIFQIADEVMKPPPNGRVVKTKTPEKPWPVSTPPSHTYCASVMKGSPLSATPVITDMSGSANQVKIEPPEINMIPVPEQLLEDDIYVVKVKDTEDSEVKAADKSDTLRVNSQD
ncbi:heat shock factor protein 5 [Notolabrus celidotus]|uniref:heat shock factor protein 5 n=1 Tax=Notolabrus celidotus TaxID=1203425 RepID=UPI00148FAF02|nr:heat shock factor protein 5 [Notolabrus celidotus]